MHPKYGVIDLGTNTFHLLIASYSPSEGIREVYRERRFIKLAEGSIDQIDPEPFRRGLQALNDYAVKLREFDTYTIKAFGTAALRTARNGPQFILEAARQTGIEVEVISGEEEARLIHRGVALAVPFDRDPHLIIDIGGGSVELILADHQSIFWSKSFPIGLAILFRHFHRNDPISPGELEAIHSFLQEQLRELDSLVRRFPTRKLVGASGTFDVVAEILDARRLSSVSASFPSRQFQPFFRKMIRTTFRERLDHPAIPNSRTDMFVVALILIDHIIRRAGIEEIIVSTYAMKEGILLEMVDQT